jgi:NAD(P)-dependent dehydrogenase (short-subunit alcohol dehydrogenase family)
MGGVTSNWANAMSHLLPGAAVMTTASIQAYDPSPILLDDATTKAGIVAYTKALSQQLIKKGVRANVVAPGPFWTVLQPSGGSPTKRREIRRADRLWPAWAPVELAPIYVLLASQEGSNLSGEVYGPVRGGGVA